MSTGSRRANGSPTCSTNCPSCTLPSPPTYPSQASLLNLLPVRQAVCRMMPHILMTSRTRRTVSTCPNPSLGYCQVYLPCSPKAATRQPSRAVSTGHNWHGTPSTHCSPIVHRHLLRHISRATLSSFPTTMSGRYMSVSFILTASRAHTAERRQPCLSSISPIIPQSVALITSPQVLIPTVHFLSLTRNGAE